MIDHSQISHKPDPIIAMMGEVSGLWDITDERVYIISSNIDYLSASGKKAALEMLSIAESEQRVWICKAEYYSLLREIQNSTKRPTREDVLEAIDNLEKSSRIDRVEHREWVGSTLSILRRLVDCV